MKIQTILFLISTVIFLGFNAIRAQREEKITLETERFSSDFEFNGHDAEVLFKNINRLLKQIRAKTKKASETAEILEGKPVYKNLTTNDLFAFIPEPAETVSGRKEGTSLYYRADIFPLLKKEEFPPPKLKYLNLSLEGGMYRSIASPNDLVSAFTDADALESVWTSAYLRFKTVYPPAADAKKYVGSKAVCKLFGANSEICEGDDFIVPSPQIHYGISFVGAQPFPLVKASNRTLSLKTYDFEYQNGAGIAAWSGKGGKDNENNKPVFVVKLAAPYVESKSFQTTDAVERKPYRTVKNILYVRLLAIWIYDARSGRIISKNGEKPVD